MTFFGETEHFSGRIRALRWSILVGKQKHNVLKSTWFIYCIFYFFFVLGEERGTKVRKGLINVSNQEKIIQHLILTIKQKIMEIVTDKNERNIRTF